MLKIVAKLEDVNTSVATIKNMGLTLTSNLQPSCATMAQCQILKDQLMESVAKLKKQNQIFRDLPTLEELLDPVEEHKTGDLPHGFEDGEASIVAEVLQEQAVASEEIVEVGSKSEDKEKGPEISVSTTISFCQQLEMVNLYNDAESIPGSVMQFALVQGALEAKGTAKYKAGDIGQHVGIGCHILAGVT